MSTHSEEIITDRDGGSEFGRSKQKSRTASTSSLHSERSDSQMSVFSNVTGFEEELYMIRRYLQTDQQDSGNFSSDGSASKLQSTETKNLGQKVLELSGELIATKSEVESLKYRADEEKAAVETSWRKKFENLQHENQSLLLENRFLAAQVKSAKEKIPKSENCKDWVLKNELTSTTLENQHLRRERDDLNYELTKIKTQFQSIKMEAESHKEVNSALKDKIKEQHSFIQEMVFKLIKQNQENTTLASELESLKKSESFYKCDLHDTREKVKTLNEQLFCTETALSNSGSRILKLNTNCKELMQQCEEMERRALKEKESFLVKLNLIEENSLRKTPFSTSVVQQISHVTEPLSNQIDINDLKHEVEQLKRGLRDFKATNASLQQDNKEFLQKFTIVDKTLADKLVYINVLEESNAFLKHLQNNLESKLHYSEKSSAKMLEELNQLRGILNAARDERSQLDMAVLKVKSDATVLLQKFQELQKQSNDREITFNQLKDQNNKLNCSAMKLSDFEQKLSEIRDEMNTKVEALEHEVGHKNTQLSQNEKYFNKQICERDALIVQQSNIFKEFKLKTAEVNKVKESEINSVKIENQMLKSEGNALLVQNIELKKENGRLEENKDHWEKEKNKLELVLSDTQKELEACKSSIDEQNAFKGSIEQTIEDLLQSNLSDRNKYQLIEKERADLKIKLLNSNNHSFSSIEHYNKSCQADCEETELKQMKALLKVLETENRDKLKRYHLQVRTLLKKVKEHMRGRKLAEGRLENLQKDAVDAVRLRSNLDGLNRKLGEQLNELLQCKSKISLLQNERIEIQLITNGCGDLDLVASVKTLKDMYNCEVERTSKEVAQNLNLQNFITISSNQIDELNRTVKNLRNEIEIKAAELDVVRREHAALKITVQDLHLKCSSGTTETIQLKTSLHAINDEFSSFKLSSIEMQKKYDNLVQELDAKVHQLKSNEITTNSLRNEINSLLVLVKTAKINNQNSVMQLRDTQEKLNIAETEKLRLQKLSSELKLGLDAIFDLKRKSLKKSNFTWVKDLLAQSANSSSTLEPLQECVESLKQEMNTLNSVIRNNVSLRGEMSLLDEFKMAGQLNGN